MVLMDNHVRRKRTYFHKRINQSKNIQFVRSLFFCVLIGITSHSLPYCQNIGNGEGQFSLDDLILEIVGNRDYPIISDFDCSHTVPMITLQQRSKMKINAQKGSIEIKILENYVE